MNISKSAATTIITIALGFAVLWGFDEGTGGHIKDAPAAANEVMQ
jgi:hypothetical protein